MKKHLLLLIVFIGIFNFLHAQNGVVGDMASGWPGSCSTNTGVAYMSASAGTTYTSGDRTPSGTFPGNKYWRFLVDWSGTVRQENNGGTIDVAVTPATKYTLNSACTSTGAMYRNVTVGTNRYVFKTLNAGTSPTGTWVFFELGGASVTVSSVSQNPVSTTVYTVDPVVVTATLSGSFPTGQGAYLRYSTDNFSTSTVVPMTGSGTSYTATIPAKAASTTVKYYVFTSGSGLNIASADADLYTINWNAGSLNGGTNYSYTVTTDPTHSFIAKYLFDLGPVSTDVTNGDITTNPDANGNYWNNITSDKAGNTVFTNPLTFSNLINSSNGSTSYGLTFNSTNWTSNGKMNGGLKTPYSSQLADPDLAIGTATEDYIFNTQTTIGAAPTFQITGLNNAKRYRFKIFGSRNTNAIRTSSYNITGITSLGGTASTVSGTLNGCSTTPTGPTYTTSTYQVDNTQSYKLYNDGGSYTVSTNLYYGNNSLVYTSGYFYPSSGVISMAVYSPTGGYAYINSMKMEEFKGEQAITFATLPTKTTSDADFSPGATASSGLTVTYSSSNTSVATIVSGQIHIVGAGSATITASQAGDGTYEAASFDRTLQVNSASLTPQTITFGALSAKNYGDASFGLTATASSGLTVSYASSNTAVATVSGSTVTIVGVGTTDITASQSGNGTYAAANNVVQTLTVNKANQTITFGSLSTKTDADVPYNLTATSSSGLTVSYASSNTSVALVSGNQITIVGAGSTTITASQAGDSNYNAATSVPQTLTVSSILSVNQNLFFDFGPNETTNGDITVNPDANGNYWNNITPAAGSAAVAAGTPGGTLVNSSNAASSYTLTFTSAGFTPNGKLNGGLLTPFASQFGTNSELAIATATEDYIYTGATSNGPVLTFSNLDQTKRYRFKIFGSRNSNTDRAGQYTLQGAGAAIVGNIQSSTATGLGGTVYIGQNVNYPTNLNVKYALTPTDTLTKSATYYGNNSSVLYSGYVQPDASGNITLTTISTTPTVAFAYINAMKIEEYSTAQTITFGALSAKNYGDADYSPGATASSGLTVSYTSSNTGVATIVSGQIHIVGPGTTTITASQAGNSSYSPATSVAQSLTVNKASSSITATGTTSYTYNHLPQGPASATESGSTGAITYSYSGTGGTTYAASATKPTNAGTYQVVATVAADTYYNSASSTPLAFSIANASTIAPVSIISNPTGTYPLDQPVTWSFDLTGSTFTAGEDLYLWIWSPSEPDFGNWGNSSSFAKLTYVSGMVWSMTLTPTTYFGKTVSEIQASAGFWLLLKDKYGNLKTADFSVSQTINRQVISISDSQTSSALTNIFADISVLNGGSLTLDASKTIHDITIERGGKVTNNNGVTLTANNFTINSDASGTGTYVDNGTTTISGTTNVNQYITSGRNWYISSPLSNATSAVFSASVAHPLYWYDEAHGSTLQWVQITNTSTSLTPMQGYIANVASSGAVTFNGSLNNGDMSITVYRTAGQTKEGFNLLGNPYPSYLNWVNATKTNLLSTLWYRTKTTPAPITGATSYVFDTYNATGGIGTTNGAKAVTNLIPPMQAFWVRVNAGQTSGALSINNSLRAHADNGNNTMKVKSGAEITQPVLRLEVSNGTISDQAVVYFNAGASNNYDDYDSPKMSNSTTSIPEIYTLAGNEQVAINGLNDMTELTLGFSTGVANYFTIKASQFTDFVTGTQIILRDNLLNYEQDLTFSEYSFYSDITANNETRFTLRFKAPSVATGINPNANSNVWISLINNQIVVNGASTESTVAVYNSVGQLLVSQNLTTSINALGTFVPGVYMVTVTNAGNKITKKVIID